jgi:hypothetical protein
MGLNAVDFSQTSGGASFDPLPAGWYKVAITDINVKQSSAQAKFPNEDYLSFEFTVQDGEYEDRKLWTNAMLLTHALFTLKGILGALGYDVSGALDIQSMLESGELEGRELLVRAKVKPPVFESDGKTIKYDAGNELKAFKAIGDGPTAPTAGAKSNSLLP